MRFLVPAAFALTLLSWSLKTTDGFCFYSTFEEGINLKVIQYDNWGGNFWEKFDATIEPGGMACCHYSDKHCNNAETQDADTAFIIWTDPSTANNHAGFQDIYVPSGGYADIGGNYHKPDVHIFDASGNPYHYTGPPLDDFNH